MKKIIFLLSAVLTGSTAFSQPKADMQIPSTILKFSPQHLIRGGLWMTGEFVGKDQKKAHQLSLEIMYRQPTDNYNGITKGVGFTAEYQYKYYLNRFHIEKSLSGKQTANGYYVGIFGQYGQYDEKSRYTIYNPNPPYNEERTNEVKTTAVYPGFVLGLQRSIGESFYIDLYAGAGMRISNSTVKNEDPSFDYKQSPGAYFIYHGGLLPKIGMSIGVGF
ncbi:MAG: hypothetical protein ACK5FT_01060 [Sphingomonadales bacterium]|jgi:hypothetical protein